MGRICHGQVKAGATGHECVTHYHSTYPLSTRRLPSINPSENRIPTPQEDEPFPQVQLVDLDDRPAEASAGEVLPWHCVGLAR